MTDSLSELEIQLEQTRQRVRYLEEQLSKERRLEHNSERRFRIIFENSPLGMVCLDSKGRIQECNEAFVRLMGSSREKLMGFDSYNLCQDDMRQVVRSAISGNREVFEGPYTSVTGGVTRHLRGVLNPLTPDIPPSEVIITYEDIEDRCREDALLRESEIRFRGIIENVENIAIQGYDQERRVIFWNQASGQLYGYSREEALGRRLEDLIIPQQMRDDVIFLVNRWIDSDIPIPAGELVLRGKDGRAVPVFSSHVMLENAKGGKEMYCIDVDMTLIRQMQNELEGHRQHLEQLVQQRTHELSDANALLEEQIRERKLFEQALLRSNEDLEKQRQALESMNSQLKETERRKTEFLSMVSHELRTPLTSVLGFARMIDYKLKSVLAPHLAQAESRIANTLSTIQRDVGIIVSESERMSNLINDVLDISKMEAGKFRWRREPVDLLEVIDKAASATSSLFNEGPVLFRKELPEKVPLVEGDEDRFVQVLVNLISNAVKFTEKGFVICSVRHRHGCVKVDIRDTGIGVPSSEYSSIFELYEQIGDPHMGKPKGSGLGLPISRQIVEQYGGRIWVESKEGQGSVFSFELPVLTGK